MKKAFLFVLAISTIFLSGCGSFTGDLWNNPDFCGPAPQPRLQLFHATNDFLVQYDELSEHDGKIHRRSYFLETNRTRIKHNRRPLFVDFKKISPIESIPLFVPPTTNVVTNLALYACAPTNLTTFTIYWNERVSGPHDLPVYIDGRWLAGRALFTSVTGAVDLLTTQDEENDPAFDSLKTLSSPKRK